MVSMKKNSVDQEKEARLKLVRLAAHSLGEHFDSVRIICTHTMEGNTANYTYGAGNLYAQQGSVRDWIIEQETMTKLELKKNR